MDLPDDLRSLEEFVQTRIPITRAFAVRVVPHSTARFSLEAPVAINHNHVGTAFGGSIYAIMTLAAYGWLWLELRDLNPQVVVQQSSIMFLRPIRETIRATCQPVTEKELQVFLETLRTRGHARFTLSVTAEENGETAAVSTGTFVATVPTSPAS